MPSKIQPLKPEDIVELPATDGPDDRLFILCGCGHRAAFHGVSGCSYLKPAGTDKSSYMTKTWEARPCTCPTPREVVYISGRTEVSA